MSPATYATARRAVLTLVLAGSPLPLAAQQAERVDLAALQKIRDEGFNRSRVMEIASHLTDVHGARLTGSPQARAAGDWTLAQLRSWGVSNARYHTWGPFGRGWSNERFSARVTAPTAYPLIAYPAAWSYGTNGPVTGPVVIVEIDSAADLARYRGTLKGKWVMSAPAIVVPAKFDALGRRWTDAQLDSIAALPPQPQQGGQVGPGGPNAGRLRAAQELNRLRSEFFRAEGIAGILQPGTGRNDYGAVLASGGGSRDAAAPPTPPVIIVATEQYGRMARTLARGVPVSVEIDADNRFHDADLNSFNIIAEIPGTDPALRDEVVMLGAHFDSWHTGTGATDNAAGSSVMLEALRILKATGLPMKRTVRLALWTGEEQGLLGSRAYVRETFGYRDSVGAHFTPAYGRFSAYYNMDNGTGAYRGVWAQGNAAVRPIFEAWMAPLRDLGMRVTSIRGTGSTDHVAFDAIGLPGFQFIQDPIEYSTRTHHSNQDLYDRLQPDDLKKNAVITAWFVYQTATRQDKLPRKEGTLTP
jgi:carboxypeptidase Q